MADSKRVRISKREGALMARLSAKEQEVYEVQCSARDLYRARRPVTDYARQVYTDPAINVEFQLMTAQLAEMENSLRLKDAELKELRASIDTEKGAKGKGKNGTDTKAVDSGKATDVGDERAGDGGESKVARASALVARCQRLEQENEELASSADVSRVAQLTSEKAVAEAYAGELKTALEEAYEYIEQLEEEREVNSGKVYALEEQLRVVASQQYAQQEYNHLSHESALENEMSHEMDAGEDQAIDDQSWGTRPNEGLEGLHPNPKEEEEGGVEGGVEGEERTENNVEDHTPSPQQRAADDMDDLYGDIGGDLFGEDTSSGAAGSGKAAVMGSETAGADSTIKDGDPMEEEEEAVTKEEVKEKGDRETNPNPKMETMESSEKRNAEEEQKEKTEEEKAEEDNAGTEGKDKAQEEEETEKKEEEEKDKAEVEGEHKTKKRRMGTRKSPRIRTRSTA